MQPMTTERQSALDLLMRFVERKPMNKKNNQTFFVAILFFWAVFIFCNSGEFAAAQEKQSQNLAKETETCFDCCNTCREKLYSDCSLSPVMIDSFGILQHETEMAVLDKFVQKFNGSPALDAFIVVYGGRTNKYGELDARTNRMKNYLLDFRKLDPSQIKFVMGGFREKFGVELWISPVKNSYPPVTPTVSPETVKFKGKMVSSSL